VGGEAREVAQEPPQWRARGGNDDDGIFCHNKDSMDSSDRTGNFAR
jgi:hypothetical protein